jgi:hypothetical protein
VPVSKDIHDSVRPPSARGARRGRDLKISRAPKLLLMECVENETGGETFFPENGKHPAEQLPAASGGPFIKATKRNVSAISRERPAICSTKNS